MLSESFSTPVLFLVFNRPDTTRRVFEAIRQVKPSRLYIAADGPRGNRPGEGLKVQAVREYVMSSIDWECEVKTLFRDKNLGCKLAVSAAIDWFFENEEEGIILEDDTLPDASFFPFCAQMLERYRQDECVMMISGDNFLGGSVSTYSYYFSKYCHIWGWASWRRAWKHYDVTMRLWPQLRANGFLKTLDRQERFYWRWCFDYVFSGRLDTWDYQWVFACWVNKGLAVMPAVNLVSNIGFGDDSTHTKKGDYRIAAFRTESVEFPLTHPESVTANRQMEALSRDIFFKLSALKYVWRRFKEMVGLK
jgi:hypothetical protein